MQKKCSLLVLSGCSFFCSELTFAQITELPPSLVTAERSEDQEEPLKSTKTLDEDDLFVRSSQGASFQELLGSLPGAFAGNPSFGTYSIRGLNQDNVFPVLGAATNPLAITYEDGVPLSTNTLRFLPTPVVGLESVILQSGPQLFQDGPAALAGSLSFGSPLPDFSNSGRLLLEYSEDASFTSYLTQNLTLLPDELALNFSFYHFDTNGQETNTFNDDNRFGSFFRNRYHSRLLWNPGQDPNQQVIFSFLYDEGRGNPQANTAITGADRSSLFDRTTNLNSPSSFPTERWAGSLATSFLLGNGLTFRSHSAYQTLDLGQNLDLDGTPFLNFFVDGDTDERRFTQSLGIGKEEGELQWSSGLYFERSDYDVTFAGVGLAPIPQGSAFLNLAREQVLTAALHGNFDWQFSNQFHLTGGLRIQHDNRSLTSESAFGPFPETSSRDNHDDTVFLPAVGLVWQPKEFSSVGLSLTRGYRSGGVSFAPILGTTQSFDAEFSWDLELKAKHSFSENLHLSASLYYSWLEDQQVASTPLGGVPSIDLLIDNSGESSRYGFELEARWQPLDGLSLYGNFNYLKTEFDDLTINGVNLDGLDFPNAPEFTAAVGLDYQHSSGAFGNVNFTWADSTFTDLNAPSITALEARSLLSARIGYHWEHASVFVFGSNLLDDDFSTFRTNQINDLTPLVGQAGAPRMFGAGLEVRW